MLPHDRFPHRTLSLNAVPNRWDGQLLQTMDAFMTRAICAALIGLFLPAAAFAACPDPEAAGPFTTFDGPSATTVYPGPDGVSVIRAQRVGGAIETYKSYRGLFMLAGPDGLGGRYEFEYEAPLDPVFQFTPGDNHEIPVVSTHNGETTRHIEIYGIVGTETIAVGDCTYETVVIDYAQRFDDQTMPSTILYYSPGLGVVLQREIDHDFTPETPRITSTADRITADPQALVPR